MTTGVHGMAFLATIAVNGTSTAGESLPMVSVGLPTYNRARYLRRAIESVLAQDYPRIQLIVSDNASTDATAEVCRPFATTEKLLYVRQERNLGPVENFSAALRLAEGEYFMWLGDDDELSENYISSCLTVLLEDPGVSLAAGLAVHHRDGVVEFREEPLELVEAQASRRVVEYYRRVHGNSVFYGVMRRELAGREPLQDVIGCDALFVARVAFAGKLRTAGTGSILRGTSAPDRGSDLTAYAKSSGRSRLASKFPWVTFGGSAMADIAWRSAAYARLTRAERTRLGVTAGGIVLARALRWQCNRIANRGGRAVLRGLFSDARYDALRSRYRRRRAPA